MNVDLANLLPNCALYRHNNDTWTVRGTIMDVGNQFDVGFTGYHSTPQEAIDAYYKRTAERYGWELEVSK